LSKYVVQAEWADAPHLSKEAQEQLIGSYPPHERDARTRGIPQLGSGAIYPVPESDFVIDPIEMPPYWPRSYAMDVGWNRTAALWQAHDTESDTVYLYSEYYRSQAEPPVHAQAIRSRGEWMNGVIDPAARGRAQADGKQLLALYVDLGLRLSLADNAVEAGLYDVWQRLSSGRIKVFRTLTNFLAEYRMYRRNEKGQVVKENDHLMDCCFAGDVKVCTPTGLLPIADLVGKPGKIVSRDGAVASHQGAALTRRGAKVVRLVFSDGASVTCTPDHRFLTPDGWRCAIEMEGQFCYNGVSQRILSNQWKSSFIQRLAKNLRGLAITFAELTSSAMAFGCTAKSGNVPMAVPSPEASTFTMTTRTSPTISRATSFSKRAASIFPITSEVIHGECRPRRWLPPLFGTAAIRGGNGISSIMKRWLLPFIAGSWPNASNAVSSTKTSRVPATISALTPAKRGIVFSLALTMRNALAWWVARTLWSIAIVRQPHAIGDALARCVSVTEAGLADVYCLSVQAIRAFCVESGLVVHNCRYIIRSGLSVATCDVVAYKKQMPTRDKLDAPYDPFRQFYEKGA
jgi:hypothetical protein